MSALYIMIGIVMAGMTCSGVVIVTVVLRRAHRKRISRNHGAEAHADAVEMAQLSADLVSFAVRTLLLECLLRLSHTG